MEAPSTCLRIRAPLELAVCAHRATRVAISPNPIEGCRTGKGPVYFGARPCCDVPAVVSNSQPTCPCAHARSHHCARSLWRGGTARELATRARCTALVVVAPCLMKGHRTDKRPLSFSAKSCYYVPATAFKTKPALRVSRRRRAGARYLWGGRCRARAPCRTGCGRPMSYGRTLHRRPASLLWCKTVLHRSSCGLFFVQPAFM